MHEPTPSTSRSAAANLALRRLSAPHAIAFGSKLLERGSEGAITFREFVSVAREVITQTPEQSAVYLAALVALDMSNEDCILAMPRDPSPN